MFANLKVSKIEKFGTWLENGLPPALGRRVGRRPREGFWESGEDLARIWAKIQHAEARGGRRIYVACATTGRARLYAHI